MSDFSGFGLPAKLMQSLARLNYNTATPIQEQTIPKALEGADILATAQTGTGKTAAFAIPVITQLMARPDTTALIMAPTRELAAQVMQSCLQLMPVGDIKTALLIGGEAMPRQFHQLLRNPRLIVGTPGRINDHLARGTLKLNKAHFLVLDEADRMLDMGFGVQIEKIIAVMPTDRQTLMFSATLPTNIIKLSSKYMNNPARVSVGSVSTPIARIKQENIETSEGYKHQQLLAQLVEREGSVIIFVKTKHGTEKLAEKLRRADHKADAIHGDLQQRRRDRVIQDFRDQKFRVLVATDVAARGLDVPHVAHVINFDLPQVAEDYIHRIGRTARNGAEGSAVNLLTNADREKWHAIQVLLGNAQPRGKGQPAGNKGGRGKPSGDKPRAFGKKKPFWNKKPGGNAGGNRDSRPHAGRSASAA